MYDFLSVILIVFGILQIILFFKVWGMTNSVKRIQDKMDDQDFVAKACYSYLKGDIDETERLLNDAFLLEVSVLSKSSRAYQDWYQLYDKLVLKYKRAFKKIDKPTPDFEKYRDPKIYLL